MDRASTPPPHTDTAITSVQTKHTEVDESVEVVCSKQDQWNNEFLLNEQSTSTLLNNNDSTISRQATSKQLNNRKTTTTTDIAWQKSLNVNKIAGKKKAQTPAVVEMSYLDNPGRTTKPVIPKRQTNYKMKKKKKAPMITSATHNTKTVDSSHNSNGTQLPAGSSNDGLSDDKVDMSKLSLTSSLPVSSKVSTKSGVSTVRITRHVDHISKHVNNDTIKSGITNSDTTDDDVTTATNNSNNNSVTNNTSISVKSVNYDSTEISDVQHLQKVVRHSSPNSRSSRKSKLAIKCLYVLHK